MELEEEKTLPVILNELLSSRQYTKLRQTISDMNTTDIAAAMSEMEEEDSLKMFRILPKDMAADVFADLEADVQQYIIRSM
ncbi:MAG: magnesium transporter, partial [Butyrivibrio sp.]|nr:magnesium transporter [Butyrivibrio sp.]